MPTACVRVASLRVNGRLQEALRLSMAIVRLFRHRQHIQEQENIGLIHVVQSSDSWIGNPLDPIGILFDTLAEASVTSDSRSYDAHYALIGYDKKIDMGIFSRNVLVDVFVMYNEVNGLVDKDGNMASNVNDNNDSNNEKLKFNHVKVPGSTQYWDTYLNAAVYIALVGLSQIRRSPDLESQRDRSYRQEERLIRKLLDIKLDSFLISTVQKKARYLIEYGILSDMVTGEHRQLFVPSDIVQIPGLVRYMFGALLPTHPDLSYDIGLRSLRYVVEILCCRKNEQKFHSQNFLYLDFSHSKMNINRPRKLINCQYDQIFSICIWMYNHFWPVQCYSLLVMITHNYFLYLKLSKHMSLIHII